MRCKQMVHPANLTGLRSDGQKLPGVLLRPEPRSASTTSRVHLARAVLERIRLEEPAPLFPSRDVKKLSDGVITRRHPVVPSVHSRPNFVISLQRRLLSW